MEYSNLMNSIVLSLFLFLSFSISPFTPVQFLAHCKCTHTLVTSIDSAFTERILGQPNENYKGYVEADATQRARHIPSHSFFLLHGLADLSAPYLHGTQLARSLTEAGVLFQYQVSWITSLLSSIPYIVRLCVF